MPIKGIDLVVDALNLPDFDEKLSAIVLVNVLHHIADPQSFLLDARKKIKTGGRIIMIEPWVTPWSRLILRLLAPRTFFS